MHSRLTPLAGALRTFVFGLSIATASQGAFAASGSEHAYSIAPGSLDAVLGSFGQQSGVMIAVDSSLTTGMRSSGLSGNFAVDEGLQRLLAPLGLQAVTDGDGYRVVARPAQGNGELQLQATQVNSNQLGTITEGSGSYTPGTIATATRMVLTPRQTPQSITVITRQHMDDFGLNSIDEVMRHTPGITVSTFDSERTNYYARGFSVENFQYDGIPTLRNSAYSSGQTLSDMAIYDRVEILKGATGLLTGAGAPGATINLIRKKPTREFKASIDVGAGSWDNYRTQVDVSGPLTDSGNIRGRAVAAYQDKHSFMDRYERKTGVYFGTLEADLSDDTLLTLGFDYQNNDPHASGWSGSRPLFDRNGERIDVKRSYNNGANWSRWEQTTQSVFATLEHSFANGWVGKGQLTHQVNSYDAPLGSVMSGPFPATGLSSIYANKFTGNTRTDAADAYFSGPFSLAGREHELVIGASASSAHWQGKDYGNPTFLSANVIDFWNFDGKTTEPDWGAPTQYNDTTTRQTAGYISARFNLTDDLNLLLGTRLANYWLTGDYHTTETGRLVPYVGVTYDLNDNFTAYASYTDIFMPQTYNRDRNNKVLEPDEGKNYEVGIKGEFYGGRLNTSLAYFEVHESNRAEPDAEYNADPTNPSILYASVGTKAKAKGFEAEMSGELAPGWQAQAGFTHKVIRGSDDEKISTWEPEDQLSLYTTYKFKGPLDRLTIGGGARWQNRSWQNIYNRAKDQYQDFSQDAYWLVDAMARYQVSEHLSTTLNVNNLFDKQYYTNIGFYNTAYYGDPRNVMVNTRWDF
ncbi:TonB-dependent siderophore receptor [Pseudomonas sp. FSL R10-0056]|uniref:TonB-dependent siderophore receptor n=1 Tax=unclassified Pseudomonas TaxID=196821 RepID=UPI001294D223|nr:MULTISPECIES: TonB-dependent siderophore receptor [unclassified Pseudomonas]MQT65282.1 TonB-dependent siderophore receptor [Pseudomonas sp. FSL R10-0056]MQT70787.1 TonB-dependent siderophore receptor [Pseudomonas sp. FSL R10-0071]MQU50432.1 TonB-dependent siderophore receptor [Pseudomonas sp. FSL A6-1183]